VNWIDTPLLVYASLTGHPAHDKVQRDLRRGTWASTVLTLYECYHVLTRDYSVTPDDAATIVTRLARTLIAWVPVDSKQAASALARYCGSRLETTDATLLLLSQEDGGTLVTTDRRLLREAQVQGIAVRNPISPELAEEIAHWEHQRLPAKGLARLMATVERWLRAEDPSIAARFIVATDGLKHPPL
jgi:predicted nucleic acid-binding protein